MCRLKEEEDTKIMSSLIVVATLSAICLINAGAAEPASIPIKGSPDISLSGTGLSAELVKLDQGLAIFNMTYDGSEFIIDLMDSEGNREPTPVYMFDPFTGSLSKAIGIEESGMYALDIKTDGNWTIDIFQPDSSSS